MKENTYLTYFEVVLIAVILGVFASTIGPQFTEADTEARISHLIDGLEMVRSHLDLYKVQHDGCLPPSGSFDDFQAAMTTTTAHYDPNLKKIPVNPFNRLNTIRFDGESAGTGQAGWRLDTETGLFQADDSVANSGL